MTAVLKYALERDTVQEIGLPAGSEILEVSEKDGKVVVYAIADKDSVEGLPTENHRFYVYGTGEDFDDASDISKDMFIGTVKLNRSVVHVFHKLILVEDEEDVPEIDLGAFKTDLAYSAIKMKEKKINVTN
jgi:hypothetical protein